MSDKRAPALKYVVPTVFVARLWSLVMGLAFTPLFLHYLGPEAFGLIGIFLTIQAVVSLLDSGISTTLNRDFAQFTGRAAAGVEFRQLLMALEFSIWVAAAVAAGSVWALGPALARRWLTFDALSPETIETCIRLMGGILLFQLPLMFYSGGMFGLQRQMLGSVLNAVWYTLRFAGGAVVLMIWTPSATHYFGWQLAVTAAMTLTNCLVLRKCLPAADGPVRFRFSLLAERGRYASGLGGISLTSLLLNQADKIILSSCIPLKEFGYYVLAWTAANGLRSLAEPLYSIAFPRFACLAVNPDRKPLSQAYHRSCQFMTVLIVPLGTLLALFAPEILACWTRDAAITQHTQTLLTLLAIGNVLLAMMVVPCALQLAHGWTSLLFWTNCIILGVLVPALVLLAPKYGAVSACWLWVALNTIYVLIAIRFMHWRLLPGELWQWYLVDIARPALPVILVLLAGRLALPVGHEGNSPSLFAIAGLFIVAQAVALLASTLLWPRRQLDQGTLELKGGSHASP